MELLASNHGSGWTALDDLGGIGEPTLPVG